jgi:hypothetical protein
LTIFFWPGEPEAGFGVALKKGNENRQTPFRSIPGQKRQASGCKGLSAPGPLPYKMSPWGFPKKKREFKCRRTEKIVDVRHEEIKKTNSSRLET